MDDERKKPPQKRGPKTGGGRSGGPHGGDRPRTGKPGFGKPFREGDKKPFAKRRDGESAGGERPQRDFRRDDRPREAGMDAPGRKAYGPRPERKPFGERSEGDARPPRGDRPFRSGPRAGGKPGFERRDDRPFGEGKPRRFERAEGDDKEIGRAHV